MAKIDNSIQFADSKVFHARLRPHGLSFSYCVLAIYVDIDRLQGAAMVPLFRIGGLNLLAFSQRDHGPRDGTALRPYIDRLHEEMKLERPARVTLICFPRIFGFVFNPISTYICMDASGKASSVIYEVRNTFGEHHSYCFPVKSENSGAVTAHECDKLFYVSPFMDMPMRYRFRLSPVDRGEFSLKIIERDHDGVILTALMQASAFEASTPALLKRLISTPLLGLKVLFAIHWQALRLWMRGHRIRPRMVPPEPVSSQMPGAYTKTRMPGPAGEFHA